MNSRCRRDWRESGRWRTPPSQRRTRSRQNARARAMRFMVDTPPLSIAFIDCYYSKYPCVKQGQSPKCGRNSFSRGLSFRDKPQLNHEKGNRPSTSQSIGAVAFCCCAPTLSCAAVRGTADHDPCLCVSLFRHSLFGHPSAHRAKLGGIIRSWVVFIQPPPSS